jgi:hypothetical protein
MEMEDVIKFLGGSTILLGVVAWLMRALFQHFLDKDAEIHLAKIKAQISRTSMLHQERGTVVKQIYQNLVDLIRKSEELVQTHARTKPEEQEQLVYEALVNFNNHFEANRIFLTPSVCSMIKQLLDSFIDPVSKVSAWRKASELDKYGNSTEQFFKHWFMANDAMKELPVTLAALEDEFRSIIGIKEID